MKNPKERLLKNIFSNWVGFGVAVAVAFYLSPFLVHHLGKEQYGIWALVFSVISYTELFDVGMRQALARYMPKYYGVEDYQKLNEVINSSTLMYSVIGTLTMITALVLAFFALGLFNVSSELLPDMRIVLIIIGVDAAITFYGMAATAIGPFHRYDIGSALAISFKILSTAAIVYFLSQGHGLITLAFITLCVTICQSTTKRIVQQRIVPQVRFGLRFISRERIREMIGYGTYSFLIVIAWLIIYRTDNVIIGIFLSATSVTYYSIAFTVISYVRNFINAIGVPLVPAVSHLEATSDLGTVRRISSRLLRYLYFLCSGICCGIFILGAEFVNLWMGPGFDLTVEILYILVIPACTFLPQVTSNSILMGIGRHRLLFYILMAEAISNVILSLVLVHLLGAGGITIAGVHLTGLHGVAIGTAIPQLIIYSFVYPVAFHRVIQANVKEFYLKSAGSIFFGALVAVPVALLVKSVLPATSWLNFFINVALICLAVLGVFVFFIVEKSDRDRVLSIIRK